MNDKQALYASDLVFIPVNCYLRRNSLIIDDMAIFCQRQGLNPRPQTSTLADTRINRDSVLCSGLHNLSYYTFLSHLFLLLIVRISQSEMLSLNLLLRFVASCTCRYIMLYSPVIQGLAHTIVHPVHNLSEHNYFLGIAHVTWGKTLASYIDE